MKSPCKYCDVQMDKTIKEIDRWYWCCQRAYTDMLLTQLTDVKKRESNLLDAAKDAIREIGYLGEQMKSRPGGSVMRAKDKLKSAIAAYESHKET